MTCTLSFYGCALRSFVVGKGLVPIMKWLSLSNARRWLISCVIYSYRSAPSLITYTDRVRNEWLLICIHTVSLSETEMDGHVEKNGNIFYHPLSHLSPALTFKTMPELPTSRNTYCSLSRLNIDIHFLIRVSSTHRVCPMPAPIYQMITLRVTLVDPEPLM